MHVKKKPPVSCAGVRHVQLPPRPDTVAHDGNQGVSFLGQLLNRDHLLLRQKQETLVERIAGPHGEQGTAF